MITCEDCKAEIKTGRFHTWAGLQWHFHCLIHRFSCTDYENLVKGLNATNQDLEDLAENDADLLMTWADQIQGQASDLIFRQNERLETFVKQHETIPKTPAFSYLRDCSRREIMHAERQLQHYRKALVMITDSTRVSEILTFGLWLQAHSSPIYYLDRAI